MSTITFTHDYVGSLAIDNGIDDAAWSYGLNTASFPTYGGEVVQILSVYIDDLTLAGTCSTYAQIEAIYSYFAAYFQTATQGRSGSPNIGDSTTSGAYNLSPVTFSYAERGWSFTLYPKTAPGFHYGREVVAPTWQLTAFVVDNTPDLNLIKNGIKALAATDLPGGKQVFNGIDLNTFNLSGEISPDSGNPDTNPFETFQATPAQATQIVGQYGTFFNNLLDSYNNDDFSSLLGGASAPATKKTPGRASTDPTWTQTSTGATAPSDGS